MRWWSAWLAPVTHGPRLAIDQRDVDHRHRDLARCVLVKLVDDHVRIGIPLQIHHDPAFVLAAGVIVDVGDVFDLVFLHALRARQSADNEDEREQKNRSIAG